MNRLMGFIVITSWGLWFGGIVALFLFVSRLFARGLGPEAAPVLFLAWEPYQLILAAVAGIATFGWWLACATRWKIALLVLLALSAASAAYSAAVVTPRLESLRHDGKTTTPEFKSLHGRSMMLYTGQASLLLLGGIALALDVARRNKVC